MFQAKIFVLIFILVSSISAQKTSVWKISDYLKNLPKEYKTFSGDFIAINPTTETTLIDDKNGYAAYFSGKIGDENSIPIFEIALFKKANGEEILVVSNIISDPVCTSHQTFFLQKSGENWIDVKEIVLPELPAKMFFDTEKKANEYLATERKIGNSEIPDLHFSLPRKGTTMKVKLDICDYVPDNLEGEINFQTFIDKSKSLTLQWNKQKGIFTTKTE